MNKRVLFLTGVTGTLGKAMVQAILGRSEDILYVLVRGKNGLSAEDRVRKYLQPKGLDHHVNSRVYVFDGDITRPNLGLKAENVRKLQDEVDGFFHVAALTALNGSEEDCLRINLEGTCNALKLAKVLRDEGKLSRFFYFSTAFVAGSLQDYCAPEDGLCSHPAHANFYESSKYRAETEVRRAMEEGLPVTIFRPAIVVGDSQTGEVSEFNVIYPFMKLFAHGIIRVLPTRLENTFNIVPIDFVTDASLAISRQEESLGRTFHLVTTCPPAIGDLLEVGKEEYPGIPEIKVVSPESFRKEDLSINEQLVYDMLQPYLGYLNDHLTFDVSNTRKALEKTGIKFPVTDKAFLKRLVHYAVEAGYLVVS